MKNEDKLGEQVAKKKPLRKKYIITTSILFFIFAGYVLFVLMWQSESEKASEAVIRQVVAETLNKKANKLTKNDFKKITVLNLRGRKISDLTFLKKFPNLKNLTVENINIVKTTKLPKWKIFLKKLHIYKKDDKDSFNLRLPDKIPNLEVLTLVGSYFSNLESISKYNKLGELNIVQMSLNNLVQIKELPQIQKFSLKYLPEPFYSGFIMKLSNLKELNMSNMDYVKIEPASELVNLKKLTIDNALVEKSLFESIGNIISLEELSLESVVINNRMDTSYVNNMNPVNLTPLIKLENLRKLKMKNIRDNYGTGYSGYSGNRFVGSQGLPGYSQQQWDRFDYDIAVQLDLLQKVLPNLEIEK